MAKKPASPEEGADTALPTTNTSTDTAPAELPVPAPAPAPVLPPKVSSHAEPIKPGARKITLAQARTHHATQA